MPLNHAQRTRIAVTAIVLLAVFMGLRRLREQRSLAPAPSNSPGAEEAGEVRRTIRVRPQFDVRVAPDKPSTSGDNTLRTTTDSAKILRPYVLDDFRTWSSIPSSYTARNIITAEGGVTLATRDERTSRAIGTLESPALDITTTTPTPRSPQKNLPQGSEVLLEMSHSEDGTKWSEWALVQRHPAGFAQRPALRFRGDDSTTAPAGKVRYRLTIETEGEELPIVSDVKIWRTGAE